MFSLKNLVVLVSLFALNASGVGAEAAKSRTSQKPARKANGSLEIKSAPQKASRAKLPRSAPKRLRATGSNAKAPAKKGLARFKAVAMDSGTTPPTEINTALGDTFVQYVEHADNANQVVVTVDRNGNGLIWVYANDTLGYFNPDTLDLLTCGDYQPEQWNVKFNEAIDCYVKGNLKDISSFDRYPNGNFIRSGSDIYYEDGLTLLYDGLSGDVKYFGGEHLKYSGGFYYVNGQQIFDSNSKYWYYATGTRLFNKTFSDLNFEDGTTFYDDIYRTAYFYDRRAIRAGNIDSPTARVDWDYNNSFSIGNRSGQLYTMYYPDGSLLKSESSPYFGKVYSNSGFESSSPVSTEETFDNGFAHVQATQNDDLIVTGEKFGTSIYVTVNNRIVPPAPKAPTDLAYSDVQENSFTLDWRSDDATASGFTVAFAEGKAVPDCGVVGTDVGTLKHHTITGLLSDTLYTASVCAHNVYGFHSDIASIEVTTALAFPHRVLALHVSKLATDSFTVDWLSGGGTTFDYVIKMVQGIPANGNTTSAACSGGSIVDQTTATYEGLTQDTTYTVAVCGRNANGELSDAFVIPVTTDRAQQAAPEPVRELVTTDVTTDSFKARWSNGGGTTNDYIVNIQAGNAAPPCVGNKTTGSPGYAFTGLASKTQYTISVCARNTDGLLSSGRSATVTTAAPSGRHRAARH